MVKKELPNWLKTGLFTALIVLIIEISFKYMAYYLIAGLPALLLSYITHIPLIIIGRISNDAILYLSIINFHDNVIPNIYGYIIVIVFWFITGSLINLVYRKIKCQLKTRKPDKHFQTAKTPAV